MTAKVFTSKEVVEALQTLHELLSDKPRIEPQIWYGEIIGQSLFMDYQVWQKVLFVCPQASLTVSLPRLQHCREILLLAYDPNKDPVTIYCVVKSMSEVAKLEHKFNMGLES